MRSLAELVSTGYKKRQTIEVCNDRMTDGERVHSVALPVPVGRQSEVVYLKGSGHNVVLGTAGSGKTSMAILRAAQLSHPLRGTAAGRTLLITFNKTLRTYIDFLAEDILDRVTVEHFHLFARGYLRSQRRLPNGCIVPSGKYSVLVERARVEIRTAKPTEAILARPGRFFAEEFRWMGHHGIRTYAAYEASDRTGRAEARMLRAQRTVVWEVYEAYLRLRKEAGYLYDLDDIACSVEEAFDADQGARLYKHIVIDEGQDLKPNMLRALAKAIPPDGSLTFFGDVAQQIYGHRLSWRTAGLLPPKVWLFEENYRNSKTIAELALAISNMAYYGAPADLVAPKQPSAEGPKPTLVRFSDEEAETAFIVERALASRGRSVAILTRTTEQARQIARRLGVPFQFLEGDLVSWSGGPGISVGNLHNGKGLEFDVVLLPYMSDARIPNPVAIDAEGPEDAAAGDGRLLYVGVTRARRELLITHTGDVTSLLPPVPALYTSLVR
jgi:superfamily I DNA/RNA helicase